MGLAQPYSSGVVDHEPFDCIALRQQQPKGPIVHLSVMVVEPLRCADLSDSERLMQQFWVAMLILRETAVSICIHRYPEEVNTDLLVACDIYVPLSSKPWGNIF